MPATPPAPGVSHIAAIVVPLLATKPYQSPSALPVVLPAAESPSVRIGAAAALLFGSGVSPTTLRPGIAIARVRSAYLPVLT